MGHTAATQKSLVVCFMVFTEPITVVAAMGHVLLPRPALEKLLLRTTMRSAVQLEERVDLPKLGAKGKVTEEGSRFGGEKFGWFGKAVDCMIPW